MVVNSVLFKLLTICDVTLYKLLVFIVPNYCYFYTYENMIDDYHSSNE